MLSDSISQAEVMELICTQIGIDHIIKLPMPWSIYKVLAAVLRKLVLAMDKNARKRTGAQGRRTHDRIYDPSVLVLQ